MYKISSQRKEREKKCMDINCKCISEAGGELPYEEYTGVCHGLGSHFQEKNSEKGISICHKNSGKGYNICKKFQTGSVILMAQTKRLNCPKQPSKSYFGDLHQAQKFPKGSYFFVKNSRKGRYRDHKVAHPRAKISEVRHENNNSSNLLMLTTRSKCLGLEKCYH